MALITFGGLATGLDTNSMIDKLVALERRRSVGFLELEQAENQATQAALGSFESKLASFLAAVNGLRDAQSAFSRTATSSDTAVLASTAGSGALNGSTTITVGALARGAIGTSATGVATSTSTIASGSGTFQFQVGTGATQSVAVSATTTLEELVAAVNELDAGVTASAVNVGTSAAPDYRLRMATTGTGTSNALSILADPTAIGVTVTQAATNASVSVSGFATAFTRESNVIGDIIPGVTLALKSTGGPVDVTVNTNATAIGDRVDAVVKAYNDIVSFVEENSSVEQDTASDEGTVTAGPLAFDGTVRSILSGLRTNLTGALEGLSGSYSLLAEVGVTSTQNGRLSFDRGKLEAALAEDEDGVLELFAGSQSSSGLFDGVHAWVTEITGSGGLLEARQDGIKSVLTTLEERIQAGERSATAYEGELRATFASLEVLVNSLQTQGSVLLGALGGLKTS